MSDAETWALLARTPFVSLGTWRRDGRLVETPVWIAPDGDALVVTTEVSTGKVKRLRNDARVRLRPSSRLGRVAPDAPTVDAVAAILGPDREHATATRALARKYGLQYRLVLRIERLVRRRQGRSGERVILRIIPVEP